MNTDIKKLLGDRSDSLLQDRCGTIAKEQLHLPGPDFIERVDLQTDRTPRVLRSLAQIFNYNELLSYPNSYEEKH